MQNENDKITKYARPVQVQQCVYNSDHVSLPKVTNTEQTELPVGGGEVPTTVESAQNLSLVLVASRELSELSLEEDLTSMRECLENVQQVTAVEIEGGGSTISRS